MRVRVRGIGALGPGFDDWEALRVLFDGAKGAGPLESATAVRPAPECIPPRERRRAPLSVKLAVAVAEQACRQAGLSPADSVCVFTSSMGDMEITDYVCRTLAQEEPVLSPTKFHNSVHNAPAGYWSISQGAMLSSNSVAGFRHTVPGSLLEAVSQCLTEDVPVLWASQDVLAPEPFHDVLAIPESCAFALALHPGGGEGLEFEVAPGRGVWPDLRTSSLTFLYEGNPAARILPVLEYLCGLSTDPVRLPLNGVLDFVARRP